MSFPKYDYDFLDGSNEETFEIKFLYLQNNKMAYIYHHNTWEMLDLKHTNAKLK
jgi:hypothetical protein